MNNKYFKNNTVDMPIKSIVTSVGSNTLFTSGELDLNNVQILSLNGFITKPDINDEVVVLPLKNGDYIALGNIVKEDIDSDSQIMIKSKSGGYIKFLKDGSISINGLKISKNGQIV